MDKRTRNERTRNLNRLLTSRRGYYFILDAIFASLLLIAGLLLLSEYSTRQEHVQESEYFSQDLLTVLSSIQIHELNSTNKNITFVVEELESGNLDPKDTILEALGEYWAKNETQKAQILLNSVLSQIDIDKEYEIVVSNAYRTEYDVVYNTSRMEDFESVTVSRRMISGIEKGSPLSGYSSSSYLKKIQGKRTSSYAYFGGFIGQGQIKFFIDELPSDLNSTNVKHMRLEGFFGNNFTLKINGQACPSLNGINFTPIADTYVEMNITHCNSSIRGVRNNFTITFLGGQDTSYITGGLLRIDYVTGQVSTNVVNGKGKYNFPGVYGIANVYDSFYVPGSLQSMTVLLHYNSSYNTYLTIGEKVIPINSTGQNVTVILNDSFLRGVAMLDYDHLSNTTIPVRFASYNTTVMSILSGDVDVVLITDYSGSMKKAVGDWSQGNLGSACLDIFNDSTTRRTNLAKCVDVEFVDFIMNYTGNRVWPVFMYNDQVQYYPVGSDKEAVKGYINSFANGAGKTCLACTLNMAYDILKNNSGEGRQRFVILMTDGTPTHCAQGSCLSNSTAFGVEYCPGLCDVSGACDYSNIPSSCSLCTGNTGPLVNLNHSANRLREDLDATIYTVGFGPINDCPVSQSVLSDVAMIGNGSFQSSNQSGMIRGIYKNLSDSIIARVDQTHQPLLVRGNLSVSTLFEDSYINYTYVPMTQVNSSQNIIITLQMPLPNCTTEVTIPQEVILLDAKVISYSGLQWSDLLVINDDPVFNLSSYYVAYTRLGDPLVLYARTDVLRNGNNTLFVETGESPENRTGCSEHNKLIFTALIPSTTSRTGVLANREGCRWTVAFEDGTVGDILVPSTYSGTKRCSYRPGNISYDQSDSYDVAVFSLFKRLDLMNDGKVYVNLASQDLEVIVTTIDSVPYLWGPSIIEARVWR